MLNKLETSLKGVFVDGMPELPEGGKKALVKYLPWINLALGIVTLWAAWGLWHWAHIANAFVDYANSLSQAFGGTAVVSNRMTVGIWLGIAVLVIEGLLYVAAFPGTRDRKKSGWNLLFYALLVNVAYGVVIFFTDYGDAGSLIGSLIGSAIGLYLLFQIRSSYVGKKAAASKKA